MWQGPGAQPVVDSPSYKSNEAIRIQQPLEPSVTLGLLVFLSSPPKHKTQYERDVCKNPWIRLSPEKPVCYAVVDHPALQLIYRSSGQYVTHPRVADTEQPKCILPEPVAHSTVSSDQQSTYLDTAHSMHVSSPMLASSQPSTMRWISRGIHLYRKRHHRKADFLGREEELWTCCSCGNCAMTCAVNLSCHDCCHIICYSCRIDRLTNKCGSKL
jgi:hypothetical protein